MLSECFNIDRSQYLLNSGREQEMDAAALERFRTLIKERKKRIPLQYLLGCQEFMGLLFDVNDSVLVPRADTETLVETVLADCRDGEEKSVLDVCTGSGCIAVSLYCHGCGRENKNSGNICRFSRVDASDLSEAALSVARKNAEKNHAFITFYKSDLLEQIPSCYDIIVSNPPYIADRVIETLEPEVRCYEPRMALSGGSDGLDFYRRLARTAGSHLNKNGRLYLEIGYDQSEAVSELLCEQGFKNLRLIKDLAGKFRVIVASSGKERENRCLTD